MTQSDCALNGSIKPQPLDKTMATKESQLRDAHSQLELIMDAIRVDGDMQDSRILNGIRDGVSFPSVLAIATQVSKRREKRL
jgi:hypothetical protein